jgi:RNA polymerase sigma-70 factor (ECF subfamily)
MFRFPSCTRGATAGRASPAAVFFRLPYPFARRLRFSRMSSRSEPPAALAATVRSSWNDFLGTYEPLRSELYRYCRHLTRSPWDAEDLAQDAMARAFVTLGQMGDAPPNPRAWLFRVASNLWLDQLRRRRREEPLGERDGGIAERDPHASREAAGTLLGQLSPQERAAVVLKEAFDLSLEEVAEALSTTIGAVKAALHRGRAKLVESPMQEPRTPAPGVLDAFCAAFNAGDLDRVTALLLDTAAVEVIGATTQYGPEAARRTVLYGMLFGSARMATADVNGGIEARFVQGVFPSAPRVELVAHRGAWVLLHWYAHQDGEAVRAVTRIDADADRVSRLQNYFFSPDFIAEVCSELGVPFRSNGYRWWVTCADTPE